MNNVFVGTQQKFSDNFQFVREYFRNLTQYYNQWNYSNIKCTYYNLDIENSLIDQDKLLAGTYETIGQMSGFRWRKILDLPLNGLEALSTTPTADEQGVTNKEKLTTAWISSNSELVCQVHDFVMFTEVKNSQNYYLRNPPLFEVVNVEKSPDFDKPFQKITMKISYIPAQKLNEQVDGLFYWMDYEKQMYGIDNAICLNRLLKEREKTCCNKFYNQNTGLYMDIVNL